MSETSTERASVRLARKYAEMRADGLLDCKFSLMNINLSIAERLTQKEWFEEACQEMIDVFESYERGEFIDITHKLR